MEEKSAESLFAEYVTVIRRLRKECPWDKEQTHESLRTPLIEETYEVVEAAADNDRRHIRNELGDLLLLIVHPDDHCRRRELLYNFRRAAPFDGKAHPTSPSRIW